MRFIHHNFCLLFSTVFYLGFSPKAPGTLASLATLPLAYVLIDVFKVSYYTYFGLIFGLFFVGAHTIKIVEDLWSSHDDKSIVIDEVIGQLVACSALFGQHLIYYFLAFGLFRLFDIWKPGPIGWIDRNIKHPSGTIWDDVLAGAFSLAILFVVTQYFPAFK